MHIKPNADILLVGTGIMSATMLVFLKELVPNARIIVTERLESASLESSLAWNNAGTGHAAYCELNYTPEKPDGSISIQKAIQIAYSFERSKQFWSYLTRLGIIENPKTCINTIPHLSFVVQKSDIPFLKKRYKLMAQHPLFDEMMYSEDPDKIKSWIPIMMEGRDRNSDVACTKMDIGTDVDFGSIARQIFNYYQKEKSISLHYFHEVQELKKTEENRWVVGIKDLKTDEEKNTEVDYIFLGAGGGTLDLLDKSGIPEAEGFGGFPVSGQWLICQNEKTISEHAAKVYGKAALGAPPMSVPHLDTRIINGKKALLFGPYAGFSTKFLKHGSYLDLPSSLEFDNLIPMLFAGAKNLGLTKYLIEQVNQSMEERMNYLKEFYPEAKEADWILADAGQRVQVIKKDNKEGGVLQFGTEVVCAEDGSIAGILGASPGASTSVEIIMTIISKCFTEQSKETTWHHKFKEIFPAWDQDIINNKQLIRFVRNYSSDYLQLK